MAVPADKNWHITATAAGFLKTQYLDGNDNALPPIWATIPDFTNKSSSVSVNVASYLTGSYDLIELVVVTGTLGGSGWSFVSPTLSYTPTGAALLTVRLRATFGATVALSNIFVIQSVVPVSLDTLGPSIPLGLKVILDSSNRPVLTFKPSTDPFPQGSVWSGVKDYGIYGDGVLIGRIPGVAGAVVGAAGTQYSMADLLIGSPAIAGSSVQTGASLSISAGGVDYAHTADEGRFRGASVTGDFFLSCKVSNVASSYQFSGVFLDARVTLDPASAHVAGRISNFSTGPGYSLNYRTAAGAVTNQNTWQPRSVAAYYALERVGNVFTFYTSTDGLAWGVADTVTLTLPATLFVGIGASALQSGVTMTATVDNIGLSQTPDIVYIDSALSGGQTKVYTLTARDTLNNESVPTPVGASITRPIGGGGSGLFKFNPGIYIGLDMNRSITDQIAQINDWGNDPKIIGFQFFTNWAKLESATTPGDYSGNWAAAGTAGIQLIKTVRNAANAKGKKLMVGVVSSKYGSGLSSFPSGLIPLYLGGSAYGPTSGTPATGQRQGGVWYTSSSTLAGSYNATSIWWEAPVMARIIALSQYYATQFDNDTAMEMFFNIGESAVPHQAGFSEPAANSQLIGAGKYFQACRDAWAKTSLRWCGNYGDTEAGAHTILDAAIASKFYNGGPDTCAEAGETGTTQNKPRTFMYDRIFRGLNYSDGLVNPSYPNYLGRGGSLSEIQDQEQGPYPYAHTLPARLGNGILADILHHANLQQSNYFVWWPQNYTGPSQNNYPGVTPNAKTFLDGAVLTNLSRPSLY